MLFRKIALFVSCALVTVAYADQKNSKVSFRADNWCPYNCDPSAPDYKNYRGYIVDIINRAFGEKNVDYQLQVLTPADQKKQENSPWKQAIWDTAHGKFDAIIGAGEDDISGQSLAPTYEKFSTNKFVRSNKVGVVGNCFFTKKGSSFNPLNEKDFDSDNFADAEVDLVKKVKLGVLKGYAYSVALDGYLKQEKNLHSKNIVEFEDDAKMISDSLNAENFVFVEDKNVMNYYRKHLKDEKANQVRAAGCIPNGGGDLYVAFSLKKGEKTNANVTKLNWKIRELQNSEDKNTNMQSILSKYSVDPWW